MRVLRTASCALQRSPEPACRRPFSSSRVQSVVKTSVADLLQRQTGQDRVTVDGYVRSVRKQKRVGFAVVGDGSSIDAVQAVLKPEHASQLSHGAAVTLHGSWAQSRGAKQSFELQTESITVQGENTAETNPLQPKFQTPEYLRTIPHLRPRIPANALLLRLRSQVIASLTKFFSDERFIQTHTPIITSSDCEGAGEVFTISSNAAKSIAQTATPCEAPQVEHFFRSPKYLTVSAQLHLEALAQAVNKVWTLSPTFRAEKSDTARHLSEFYMLEAEQCFVHDLEDVLGLVERMLRAVAIDLKDSHVGNELLKLREASSGATDGEAHDVLDAEKLQQRWIGMSSPEWPRITYNEALKTLYDQGYNIPFENGLDTEHERALASLDKEARPTFVTHYPKAQKPFYMLGQQHQADAGVETMACFDLLVPDLCELVGGSLREHRSSELLQAMEEKMVGGNNLEWYQDLRQYGSVPHGGFGMGFDRLLCYLGGVGNIRDIVAFPRWYGRCDC